ncbi:MAG: iron-sulfur cluster assembly protein, partial [Sphingobacteriales bacterium]
MTSQDILKALRHVQEPDLKKDLVTLNMIQDIQISGNKVSFVIVLTTPACPLKELMKRDCIKAIQDHVSAHAEVEVKFTANTTSNR